jgi:hypothetical protein
VKLHLASPPTQSDANPTRSFTALPAKDQGCSGSCSGRRTGTPDSSRRITTRAQGKHAAPLEFRSYDRHVEVKLGKRHVENVTVAGPGAAVEVADRDATITVSVELGPPPDQQWIEIWKRGDFPIDLEEPVLHDRPWLLFTAEKKDLERAWQAIKARLEATNLGYAGEVIPAREAARRLDQANVDEATDALEDAQRLVDELE